MSDPTSSPNVPRVETLRAFPASQAELEAIYTIVRTLNAHSNPQEIVDVLAKELRPFIHFDSLFVSLLRDDALEAIAFSRPDHGFRNVTREEHGNAQLWEVIDKGVLWSEANWGGKNARVKSFINVPLCVGKRAVGILHLDLFSPRQWTTGELGLARLVGELIGGAVESIELLRQREEQEQIHAENVALLRAIQEATSEGICLVSEKGELLSYNRRFADLWQLDDKTEAFHRENGTVMRYVLDQLADPDEFLLKITALWEQPSALVQDEVTLRDGRVFERYSAPAIAPATDGSSTRQIGRIWTFSDITDRKRTEHQLAHQAFYDAVTGLPNRLLFAQRLEGALKNLTRSRRYIAVLFLDLDRFKVINDSLGHDTGDYLLVQVADRLRDSLRPGDIAARFGGDEFVVLLEDILLTEDAVHVAERIAAALNSPFSLAGHTVSVTASVGIVICGDPHESPDDILRKADVAMYSAKNEGKARHQIFSDSLSQAAVEELQLEIDLAVALKKGQFEVFYQPLIDLRNNRVEAFEALLRWRHPRRGFISPSDFVPRAEELGLIVPIGEWVLREACQQAKRWSEQSQTEILMHVNLSIRQFELTDMVEQIARVLRETDLPASQLLIEITESVLMHDSKGTTRQLEELKQIGVGISIDDFGTGYSSLAYLEMFPLDLIKIDREFVGRMDKSETLVRAITSLGHALDLEVAAEGIESPMQLATLRSLGIRWAQGYLFSPARPASEAESWLQKSVERMLL